MSSFSERLVNLMFPKRHAKHGKGVDTFILLGTCIYILKGSYVAFEIFPVGTSIPGGGGGGGLWIDMACCLNE